MIRTLVVSSFIVLTLGGCGRSSPNPVVENASEMDMKANRMEEAAERASNEMAADMMTNRADLVAANDAMLTNTAIENGAAARDR
ncbi:MAG: hypothetical protein B7Y45_08425 [Sphingomonas sp. 28-66-16]|nr:MAG: hypothetical protein B7Y45_08425 [Sphingomonas sp. 28-66-16]